MPIHVVGQVTCELSEEPDLGSQLQLHLRGKNTHLEVRVMEKSTFYDDVWA